MRNTPKHRTGGDRNLSMPDLDYSRTNGAPVPAEKQNTEYAFRPPRAHTNFLVSAEEVFRPETVISISTGRPTVISSKGIEFARTIVAITCSVATSVSIRRWFAVTPRSEHAQ